MADARERARSGLRSAKQPVAQRLRRPTGTKATVTYSNTGVLMRELLTVTIVLACVFVPTDRAHAQSEARDTLPFRKGQWAVEFPVNRSVGIGFLRFGSNRSALQLDAQFVVAEDETQTNPADFASRKETDRSVDIQIGRRTYRPLASKTAMLFSAGVTPGWYRGTYSETSTSGTFSTIATGWSAGVFLEAGASYFVTPKLSLGMLTGASGFYRFGHARTSSPAYPTRVSKHREYQAAVLAATIVGALYF